MDTLLRSLRALYLELRAKIRSEWKRDLPLDEILFDRWERADSLGFGEGSSIYHNSYVYGDVSVGENTWIGPFTVLDGSGGLEIGSNCSISAGVQIYTHDSVKWAVSGGTAEYGKAPTKIESNCYVGPNTIITKGISIGEGCVIGANSIVLEDIPCGSKAQGSPCRVTGKVVL